MCSCWFGHDALLADCHKWHVIFFLNERRRFCWIVKCKSNPSLDEHSNLWVCRKVQSMSYCRGIPRGSLGGLVVMESDHDEVPMSITNVPNNPGRGVCVEDQRQQDDVSYQHDGADQYDHQTNKDLPHKDRGDIFSGKHSQNFV